MSRFRQLEIEPRPVAPQPEEKPEEQRDEKYYCERADAALRHGDPEPALRFYSRALGMDPHRVAAWIGQIRCLIWLGENKEASLWADRALAALPDHPDILAGKAAAVGRDGDSKRALALSDLSIKTDRSKSWFVWWARGDVLLAESFENARYCFEKAKEAATVKAEVFFDIGRSLLAARCLNEAVDYLELAELAEPGNPAVSYYYGMALKALGRRKAALQAVETCLRRNPSQELRTAAMDLRDSVKISSLFKMLTKRI